MVVAAVVLLLFSSLFEEAEELLLLLLLLQPLLFELVLGGGGGGRDEGELKGKIRREHDFKKNMETVGKNATGGNRNKCDGTASMPITRHATVLSQRAVRGKTGKEGRCT